jgi:protoheme IX farnesyltransferase
MSRNPMESMSRNSAESSLLMRSPYAPSKRMGLLWTNTDLLSSAQAYFQLTKPTITLLVVVTTMPTLFMASATAPSLGLVLWTLLGTYLCSSAAGAFNHILERDKDAKMERTVKRPVASGRIGPASASFFAWVLLALGTTILFYGATPLAAGIAAASAAFYALFYTLYLKPRTAQNIVIGGAAGSVGPLIGWAAASGQLSWEAWVLFGVIFLWTPPHFWCLALKYKDQYAKAGFPMMPVVYGDKSTKQQIFGYSLTLLPAIAALGFSNVVGLGFLIPALLITVYFCYLCYLVMRDRTEPMGVFLFSCLYVFVVFGALFLERLLVLYL